MHYDMTGEIDESTKEARWPTMITPYYDYDRAHNLPLAGAHEDKASPLDLRWHP